LRWTIINAKQNIWPLSKKESKLAPRFLCPYVLAYCTIERHCYNLGSTNGKGAIEQKTDSKKG
jgi:hypothetical protein